MTLNKIGRADEARTILEKMRELCKQEDLIWNMDVQGLLSEAEKLISTEEK